MNAFKWGIIAYLFIILLIQISRTGKERAVLTPRDACLSTVEVAVIVWLVTQA